MFIQWKSLSIIWVVCLALTGLALWLGQRLPGRALTFVSAQQGYQLLSLDVNRGLATRHLPVDFFSFSLSPDGRFLAYSKPILFGSEVRIVDLLTHQQSLAMPVNGSQLNRLIWSPDGRRVAYGDELGRALYVLDIQTGEQQLLADSVGDTRISWSPAGKRIAYTSSQKFPPYSIALVDVENRVIRQLGEGVAPSWSPDGRTIAFVSGRDNDLEIYRMDADGMNVRRLTQTPGTDTLPLWSPDGQMIAFESTREGPRGIFVMDADGQNQRRVTQPADGAWSMVWSPDSQYIAFLVGVAINTQLYIVRIDGSDQRPLTHDPFSHWSPQWWSPE